jgi:hypothetical protein
MDLQKLLDNVFLHLRSSVQLAVSDKGSSKALGEDHNPISVLQNHKASSLFSITSTFPKQEDQFKLPKYTVQIQQNTKDCC